VLADGITKRSEKNRSSTTEAVPSVRESVGEHSGFF
jgi:hypothetical protein